MNAKVRQAGEAGLPLGLARGCGEPASRRQTGPRDSYDAASVGSATKRAPPSWV